MLQKGLAQFNSERKKKYGSARVGRQCALHVIQLKLHPQKNLSDVIPDKAEFLQAHLQVTASAPQFRNFQQSSCSSALTL